MTCAGLLFPWRRFDGSEVEVSYCATSSGIELRTARDASGCFVDLDEDERESCVLDILAEQALAE